MYCTINMIQNYFNYLFTNDNWFVRKRQAQKICCRLRTDESWSRYKSVKNQVKMRFKWLKPIIVEILGISRRGVKATQLTGINALKIGDVSYISPQEIGGLK